MVIYVSIMNEFTKAYCKQLKESYPNLITHWKNPSKRNSNNDLIKLELPEDADLLPFKSISFSLSIYHIAKI